MALHGPIGSMAKATEGMKVEQRQIITSFCLMMFFFGCSTVAAFWTVMQTPTAIVSSAAFVFVARYWFLYCERIYLRFYWEDPQDEWQGRDTTDFDLGGGDPALTAGNPLQAYNNNMQGRVSESTGVAGGQGSKIGLYSFIFGIRNRKGKRGNSDQQGSLRESLVDGDIESGGAHQKLEIQSQSGGYAPSVSSTGTRGKAKTSAAQAGKNVMWNPNVKAYVAHEGYLTMRNVDAARASKHGASASPGGGHATGSQSPSGGWERKFFILQSTGNMYFYRNRQDMRNDPKSFQNKRPLELSELYVRVDNVDKELRSELEGSSSVDGDGDGASTIYAASTAASQAALHDDALKVKPYRFQLTLISRENSSTDERHNRNHWLLRCDTEDELNLWVETMRVICPSAFQD